MSGKPNPRWNKEVFKGFLREGLKLAEIGRRMGVHKSTVGGWKKKHPSEPHESQPTPSTKDLVEAVRHCGGKRLTVPEGTLIAFVATSRAQHALWIEGIRNPSPQVASPLASWDRVRECQWICEGVENSPMSRPCGDTTESRRSPYCAGHAKTAYVRSSCDRREDAA
jgi:hypothetical protein